MSQGESTKALVAARQALSLDDESPEVHNLLGVIYAMEGDFGEAMACYQRAVDLDEDYLDPLLNAAELLIHSQDNPEEAVDYCRKARDLVELEEEKVEVVLLETDALLTLGRRDEARKLLGEIEDLTYEMPVHYTAVGRALFEVGDFEKSSELIEKAVSLTPESTDAHYCRGLLYREAGRRVDAVRSFLTVLEQDALRPPPPWISDLVKDERLAAGATALLPLELRSMLAGTAIHFEPRPSRQQVMDELDPRAAVWAHTVDGEAGIFGHLWIFFDNFEYAGIRPVSPETDLAELIQEELVFHRH